MGKTKWILDPDHSWVYFRVRHLMISSVAGQFRKFNVEAFSEGDDLSTLSGIVFTADVDSIDTNNNFRDTHLKSADFFNAATYKQIVFSDAQYQGSGTVGTLSGNLTIRDTTRPITVNVEIGGIVADSHGRIKAGFSMSGKLNRTDFGLTWDAVTEAGHVVVSDEVKFFAEIQLIKQV